MACKVRILALKLQTLSALSLALEGDWEAWSHKCMPIVTSSDLTLKCKEQIKETNLGANLSSLKENLGPFAQNIQADLSSIYPKRKSSPKGKSWGWISRGRPRGYPGGRPGAKASVRPSKSWKTSILVRTSMTRRRGRPCPQGVCNKNFGQKNFGLNCRSLI